MTVVKDDDEVFIMRLNILGVLSVLALLVLAGCEGQQGQNQNQGVVPFIGGSEGLSMEFAQGAPPEEVADGGQMPFAVSLILENVGEHPILSGEGEVRLVGIDPTLFDATESSIIHTIEHDIAGAKKLPDGTQVPGELYTVYLPDYPGDDSDPFRYLPDLMGTDEILLRAEVCYDYLTHTTTQVCIKDEVLHNLQNDKICTVSGPKVPHNSGGPLHVSEVKENPLGQNNMMVTFKIEHVGTGLFFDKYSDRGCDDSITNPDENVVRVKVYFNNVGSYDPPEITCGLLNGANQGIIQLYQGQAREVSCTLKGDPGKDRIYQDILNIDLEYKYMNYVETPIIIRDMSMG